MNAQTTAAEAQGPDAGAAPPQAPAAPDVPSGIGPAEGPYPWGLYFHVIVVSVIGGFLVLGWFVLYEALNKLIWENGYVTGHAWMFPVDLPPVLPGRRPAGQVRQGARATSTAPCSTASPAT